jgi:hypothetical protein
MKARRRRHRERCQNMTKNLARRRITAWKRPSMDIKVSTRWAWSGGWSCAGQRHDSSFEISKPSSRGTHGDFAGTDFNCWEYEIAFHLVCRETPTGGQQ